MSPRTEKQYEQIREQKRTLILDTALRLFADEGFHSTSISKIAKLAGISKGLMYNYFTSKEELLREIVISGINDLTRTFDPNRDGILTTEELEYFINQTFEILKSNTKYWKLYFAIILQPSVLKMIETDFIKIIGPMFQMLEEYFRKKGYENPDIESKLFGAILDGLSFHYVIDPENFPLEKIKRTLINRYIKKH
jgi:AcrR family transcriptional regulator